MPMTLEQLRNQLSAIEPDDSTFLGIGSSEIPLLDQLLQDEEAWMASRAVFALSRQSDRQAMAILSRVVDDPRPEVRVSLAASMRNLQPKDANDILLKLLADTDVGVRQFAVEAVSRTHSAAVHAKLKDLESLDPIPLIRNAAGNRMEQLRHR